MSGKGDKPRPVDAEKFGRNWERIYGGDGKSTDGSCLADAVQDGGSTPPASNELETDGSKD